ncbi:MAG: PEP-CTERM sorting domain-containing protein [Nitrosomonas sp.]|nr:PEP-CTERM sorting domain-containing protein [Nitrosomonas sp.]
MNIRKSAIAMATGLVLGVVSAASSAAVMKFEDNDLDFLLRGDLTAPVTTDTTFQVGDILVSVFEIDVHTIDSVNAIPAGQELTGVAAIQITSIVGSGAGSMINFGAVDGGGLDGILSANLINLGMPLGAGAAVAMFLNDNTGANNLQIGIADGTPQGNPSCTSLADCLTEVTMGEKYQVDGFLGDSDEFWKATILADGGANPATVLGLSNSTLVAGFNAALSNMFQKGHTIGGTDLLTGLPCDLAASGCAGATFSGTITGGGGIPAGHGAFAHSDFDGTKNTIPEPATLLLLASGLLGIGASRWTKKSKV